MKNPSAVELGKKSAEKRLAGLSPEQRKEYMRKVRAKQSPKIDIVSAS